MTTKNMGDDTLTNSLTNMYITPPRECACVSCSPQACIDDGAFVLHEEYFECIAENPAKRRVRFASEPIYIPT